MCDAVFLDGQQLKMRALETRQQHVLDGLDGDRDLSLIWDLQFPELGNTVEIVTAYMRIVVWLQHEGLLKDVRLPLLHHAHAYRKEILSSSRDTWCCCSPLECESRHHLSNLMCPGAVPTERLKRTRCIVLALTDL